MSEEERISAGLYIGRGPKPENVEADMYVDMEGKNVGVYIGGGKPKTLVEILEEALRDNPKHASELQGFINDARININRKLFRISPLQMRLFFKNYFNSANYRLLLYSLKPEC